MLHYSQNEQYPQLLLSNVAPVPAALTPEKPITLLRVHYIRLNPKDGDGGCSSDGRPGETMKTVAPNIRRRRRCDRHHLELYRDAAGEGQGSKSASASTATSPIRDLGIPAPPITPPPAFLSAGYRRSTSSGAAIKRSLGAFSAFKRFRRKATIM